MPDRLRELLDVVLGSLDEPAVDGAALAARAHFSRDHLDRLLSAATGESPVALRRRLLLERAAWQLAVLRRSASEVAATAGYGSLAAFSRAFARAYGMPPGRFADAGRPYALPAPNGIHFHPPAGLLLPGGRAPGTPRPPDPTARQLAHHVARVRALLGAAATRTDAQLRRPLRPGFVVTAFDGEEPTAALMAERLVTMLEVWVAAIAGEPHPLAEAAPHDAPPDVAGDLLPRFDHAAGRFMRLVDAIGRRGAWDDAFVDALCEPPQSFTYGGVVAHVLTFGAVRREALAAVLRELGAPDVPDGDPLAWEAVRRTAPAATASARRR